MYLLKQAKKNLKEVRKTKNDKKYSTDVINTISRILLKDPIRYRYYGAFWWAVKKELIAGNKEWLDDHIDKEWLERTDSGNTATNLMMAWIFSEERMDNMESPSDTSTIELEGESVEYVLHDPFMEQLAQIS